MENNIILQKSLKILHLSALDLGGAATATLRLHKGLLSLGINSNFLTLGKCNRNIPNKDIFELTPEPISLAKVLKKSFKVKLGLESPHDFYHQQTLLLGGEFTGSGFNFPDTLQDITHSQVYKDADIIHLHWVAGWLDYASFFKKNKKPIIWTLHDLNPFSGGLHYALGTSISETQMGNIIDNPLTKLQITHNRNLKIKENSLKETLKIKIVSPSHWLEKQASKSLLFSKYENHCIHNGLDTTIFKSHPTELVRSILGLENQKTLLFIADDIDSIYKGFALLVQTLEMIKNKTDYQYIVIGRDKKNVLKSFSNIIHLGYIQDERLMALVYNAADIFILPSLMDNFPNTMIESLCCGTPVIAFPTGGMPEAIKHGENGIICEKADANLLAQALIDFYEEKYTFAREKIATDSADKYNYQAIAKQYILLYQDF